MMMKWIKAYAAGQNKTAKESDTRLREVAAATEAALLEQLGTGPDGLTEEQAEAVRERTGPNRLARSRPRRSGSAPAPTAWPGPAARAHPAACWKPSPTPFPWCCCC